MRLKILAIAVLFVWSGSYANAATFEEPKLSWSGRTVHVSVKTDLPDGSKVNMAVSANEGGALLRGEFSGRVESGQIIASAECKEAGGITLKSGHSLFVIFGETPHTFEFGD